MLGVLFALQTASVPACATPALCHLLESAAAANQRAMLAPGGYRAVIETENATLGRREGRIEGATILEQTNGVARWSSDGGFEHHVVGARSFPNAFPLSRIAFLRIGWVVPTLAGERLQLITQSGAGKTSFAETLTGPLAPEIVVHPLASDRDKFYSYTGDTARVLRRVDGVQRSVIPVEVIPVTQVTSEQTLFEGEMDLDPETHAVVRLFGRFIVVGRQKRGGMLRLPVSFESTVTLVDLVNQRLPDGSWAPRMQRYEFQTASRLALGYGAARRVISRFYDVTPIQGTGGPVAIAASTTGYVVTSAPRDSLRHFRRWHAKAGAATDAVSEADFSRYRPERLQPNGSPIFAIQGSQYGDFYRLNRIEGLFTGMSGFLRFRDAAPGFSLHATGGRAWSEKTYRGAGGIGWEKGSWLVEGGAARTLDVTNKFRNQFDNPTLGGLAGRDPWDYVDRRRGGVAITRAIESARGSTLRLEFARVRDDSAVKHMKKSLAGGRLRINRGITEGTYWRSKAIVDLRPDVSPLFARDGIGFRGEVERGDGDLDYTRVEGRVVVRKSLNPVFLIARLHAGAVFATDPPPQQLFEMGGPAGLPGYEYKEFAGDRAMLFRVRLSYPIAFLAIPVRFGSGVVLPSLAPAISVGFQGGFTDAKTTGGPAAVRALGNLYDDKTGDPVLDTNGDPVPTSVATDQFKKSVDIRLGFFGDALAFGFARALEKGRKTKFILALGRQF